MSRRHHPLVIDEGAAAEVVATVQGHLVGNGVCRAGIAPNDLVIIVNGQGNLSEERKGEANIRGWSPQPWGYFLLIMIL